MAPKLNTKTKKEASRYAKQCIHFCLQLENIFTISHKEFKDLNWLPVITRFEQCVISIVFKFVSGSSLYFLNEVFKIAPEGNVSLSNNFLKLK